MHFVRKGNVGLPAGFLLSIALLLLLAMPAAAREDPYTYPGYDASASGYIDLMDYVKRVTVTYNGKDYTQAQLQALANQGTPVSMHPGEGISFNFLFALDGRAHAADDPTRLDEDNSRWVTYPKGTTRLDGSVVAPGERAILDDSSLMNENTSKNNCFLRMDVSWLQAICGSSYRIEYTSANLGFYQSGNHLYLYFPAGIGSATYAGEGWFSLTSTVTAEFERVSVPMDGSFYADGTERIMELRSEMGTQNIGDGNINSYGRITVKKKWVTNENPLPQAKILLHYVKNGTEYTATRTITGTGEAYFDIDRAMTDCRIEEDMSGLPGYVSALTVSADNKTYTFTNSKLGSYRISVRAEGRTEELAGVNITLGQWETIARTAQEKWTTDNAPKDVLLPPGSFLLDQIKVPDGYACVPDAEFVVNDDLTLSASGLEVDGNHLILYLPKLYVLFKVTDPDGKTLPGAALTLTDTTTGKVVATWTTGNGNKKITYASDNGTVLVAGHTYTVTQQQAPTGYTRADAVTFVFNGDGTIPGWGYHTIRLVNKPSNEKLPQPDPDGSSPGKGDGTDGKGDGTDGKGDGTDGKGDGTDGKGDGTDGKGDGTDGTDGTNGSNGADGTGGTGGTGGANGIGGTDGTDGSGETVLLHTGDTLLPWLYLALAILCFCGSFALFCRR